MKPTQTFEEACAYLNVSATSMHDLIAVGEIPAAKISKSYVLRTSDLDSYLAEKIQTQTEQRRAGYRNGKVVRIVPEAGQARRMRMEKPVLPPLPSAAAQ
jgi:excisionase family DNA binding protein